MHLAVKESYSNTYAPLSELIDKFETALQFKGVVGIAIGTRADCLSLLTTDQDRHRLSPAGAAQRSINLNRLVHVFF